MTRVLYIVNSLDAGGAQRTLIDLAKNLDRRKYKPHVLCLHKSGLYMDQVAVNMEVSVLALPYRMRIREILEVGAMIRKYEPAIVHTFLTNANRWGTIAARISRVPIVVNSLQNCYYYETWSQKVVDRLAFSLASHAVSCSEAVRKFHVQYKRYPPRKISTIYNAVDTAKFRPAEDKSHLRTLLGIRSDAMVIGITGGLIKQKGHEYLLEAAADLHGKNGNIEYVFVGDGPLRSDLEAKAASLGLKDHVFFLGVRRDVGALIQGFDIFTLPSLWEGFGIAIAEAMASGVPVVATSVDGIRELVDDGSTGILVPPGDPIALGIALSDLAGDPLQRKAMGAAGRTRIIEQFSLSAMVSAYEKLYSQLLDGTLPDSIESAGN